MDSTDTFAAPRIRLEKILRFADGALIIAPSFLRQRHRSVRDPQGKTQSKREDKRNAHPESGGSTWRGCWSRRDPEHGCGGQSLDVRPRPQREGESAAPLANFQAKGDNLVRLLAGAFDPAAGRCRPGIAFVTARHCRPTRRSTGSSRCATTGSARSRGWSGRPAAPSPASSPTTRTWCARHLVSARRSPLPRPFAGPATTSRRGACPWPLAASRASSSSSGTRTYRVYLFPDDPRTKATARALGALPGVAVVEDSGVVLDVRATAEQIPAIAALPAVQWIGVKPRVVPHNINARWVNDTGVRDVYAATAPGRLTGAGQTAAVADTGLNYTYDLNGRAHIGFRDCNPDGTGCKTAIYTQVTPGNAAASIDAIQNNATNHRKVVAYFDIGSTGPNMYDESSHGSHTAGLRRRRPASVRHLHGLGRPRPRGQARAPEHRHRERRPRSRLRTTTTSGARPTGRATRRACWRRAARRVTRATTSLRTTARSRTRARTTTPTD